jgi:hypothetical protein
MKEKRAEKRGRLEEKEGWEGSVSASNNLTILIFISQDSDPICHKLWQSF